MKLKTNVHHRGLGLALVRCVAELVINVKLTTSALMTGNVVMMAAAKSALRTNKVGTCIYFLKVGYLSAFSSIMVSVFLMGF